ncbi:hypothetical protein ACE6ED_13205 [Paenibacillus sp. CN-4]|uniref:hypothetical protein n=1 Tax=Paenibacillus nanchangensis TaxID=3348343 RepID=UPI00397C4E26
MGFKIGTFEFRPCPKPDFKRKKPTAKQRGAISKAVYSAALARSGGRCERADALGSCSARILSGAGKSKAKPQSMTLLCSAARPSIQEHAIIGLIIRRLAESGASKSVWNFTKRVGDI